MTDKEIKTNILAEIERLKTEEYYYTHDEYDGFVRNALDKVVTFINSLPEEPVSEDSDNAARDYADACGYDNDTHFMARQLCVEHFKAGAKWDREKIINKVVEWLKENVHKYADSFVDSFELCKDLKQIF